MNVCSGEMKKKQRKCVPLDKEKIMCLAQLQIWKSQKRRRKIKKKNISPKSLWPYQNQKTLSLLQHALIFSNTEGRRWWPIVPAFAAGRLKIGVDSGISNIQQFLVIKFYHLKDDLFLMIHFELITLCKIDTHLSRINGIGNISFGGLM